MAPARIVNAVLWLWVWLSDVMMPPALPDGFWAEKGRQLVRLNSNFDDPPRMVAYAVICAIMWFGIDRALRRHRARQMNDTQMNQTKLT